MKKLLIALLGLVVILGGLIFILLSSADSKNLERTPVTIDMPDTFEK